MEFIDSVELAATKEIKKFVAHSAKSFNKCMDELFKELLVTAIKRERTMNENFCSFWWGTSSYWEQIKPLSVNESLKEYFIKEELLK
jgi:hypothetical protein